MIDTSSFAYRWCGWLDLWGIWENDLRWWNVEKASACIDARKKMLSCSVSIRWKFFISCNKLHLLINTHDTSLLTPLLELPCNLYLDFTSSVCQCHWIKDSSHIHHPALSLQLGKLCFSLKSCIPSKYTHLLNYTTYKGPHTGPRIIRGYCYGHNRLFLLSPVIHHHRLFITKESQTMSK